ncbi:TraR/DksA family transcriptional regulator [Glaesserella parasuis]|uniref:TraR/DksA family transcriptional regulator n=1 Tax=Glaesserella parasuis TaxID=738 RepID=UPI001365AF2C|nr:TraR/DksA family transcriptional regulator [Glaesserella parasuis]MDE3944862.1 TraR/DksA family transcriptional regulator [Glaesserella parasuis]MDE3946746.1 TraR/DksA family transcriptional regulator [Glaesserella parasuis]MWQ85407.1 TraR/DksA family transcriptional regulator [Glaesserella parasuis]
MKDQIDRANELAEKEREFALAKLRNKPTAYSLTHCEDCDEPIPEARRQNVQGCTRCIECQQIHEYKQKGYRK